jgi:predicted PurR-regulated permease PerM
MPWAIKPIFKTKDLIFWIGLAVLVGLFWMYLGSAARPFLIGLVLAYIMNPLVRRLMRAGMNRTAASITTIMVFFFGIGALIFATAPFLVRNVTELLRALPALLQQAQGQVDIWRVWLEERLGTKIDLAEATNNISLSQFASTAIDWFTSSLQSFGTTGKALMNSVEILLIVPFAVFYFLMDWERLTRGLRKLVPISMRRSVYSLSGEIDAMIGSYFRGQVIVCLALGSFYALSLWAIGLRYGVAIGVISGLLSFIPYLGTGACLVLSFGVGLAQFWPDWTMLILIGVVIGVGQFIEGNFLTPLLVGRHVGLHPLALMFGLIAMGSLYGFVGLLFSVPLTGTVAIILRRVMERYRASDFFLRPDSTVQAKDLTSATPAVPPQPQAPALVAPSVPSPGLKRH